MQVIKANSEDLPSCPTSIAKLLDAHTTLHGLSVLLLLHETGDHGLELEVNILAGDSFMVCSDIGARPAKRHIAIDGS